MEPMILGLILLIALPIFLIYYSSYTSKKEEEERKFREWEEQKRIEQEEEIKRKEKQKAEQIIREKELLNRQRSKRFFYLWDGETATAHFNPQPYCNFMESIHPFFRDILFYTDEYHEILCDLLRNTPLNNIDVHSASLLHGITQTLFIPYNGELFSASHTIDLYVSYYYLCKGFHRNFEATQLRDEIDIFNRTAFFYSYNIFYQEISPRTTLMQHNGRKEYTFLLPYLSAFFDIATSPDLAFSRDLESEYPQETISVSDFNIEPCIISTITNVLTEYADHVASVLAEHLDIERDPYILQQEPELTGRNYYDLLIIDFDNSKDTIPDIRTEYLYPFDR